MWDKLGVFVDLSELISSSNKGDCSHLLALSTPCNGDLLKAFPIPAYGMRLDITKTFVSRLAFGIVSKSSNYSSVIVVLWSILGIGMDCHARRIWKNMRDIVL